MVKQWRNVGLIVNPSAGKGVSRAYSAARTVIEQLRSMAVYTGRGSIGEEALSGWSGQLKLQENSRATGKQQTRSLMGWIATQELDAVVVVGGDGTLSDVAEVCIGGNCRLPILGVGTGSTNVGRLITCAAASCEELHPDDLEQFDVDCLTARVDERTKGFAFNDITVGYTIVGTIEGKQVNLDAARHMQGEIVAGIPKSIGNSATRVTRIVANKSTEIATGLSVGTVIAGFAEPSFFGKAVSGGVCLTVLAGMPAGCLVCDVPLARVDCTSSALLNAPPIRSSFVSLSDGVTVVMENANPGAVLCVDGNPVHLLGNSDQVIISVHSRAVVGLRSKRNLRPR